MAPASPSTGPAPVRRLLSRRITVPALAVTAVAVLLSAAAFAATETAAVPSYWRGLLWALSLLTTVGFVDGPPSSVSGSLVAAALMSLGFLLLSLVSAALASLFVREDEQPSETEQHVVGEQVLLQLQVLTERVHELEQLLARDAVQGEAGEQQD